MGPRFLIDSNVIIEFIGGSLPAEGTHWFVNTVNEGEHAFSPISQIEVLGYNAEAEDLERLRLLFSGSLILPVDQRVVEKAIQIRRQKKVKLPDAIIAATALVHGLQLVTRNEKDFRNIPGLEVINPHTP